MLRRHRFGRLPLLGLAVLAVLMAACERTPEPGPLEPPPGTRASSAGSRIVPFRKPFTFSEIIVWNHGERPVVLDSIELVEASDQIEIVGALAALRQGQPRDWIGGTYRFPPRYPFEMHPLQGFVVPPASTPEGERGVQIIIGLAAQRGSEGYFRGVAINYHVGEVAYRYVDRTGFRACAGPALFRGQNPLPCPAVPLLPPE